jgi:hypothetical protein
MRSMRCLVASSTDPPQACEEVLSHAPKGSLGEERKRAREAEEGKRKRRPG